MGAVWVSGAPVAKPIPKIKSCSRTCVVRAHSINRALGANGLAMCCVCVMQHELSPLNALELTRGGPQDSISNFSYKTIEGDVAS